jgi:hypothetical protein
MRPITFIPDIMNGQGDDMLWGGIGGAFYFSAKF